MVRRRRPGQLIVGFAAETENRLENGRAKLLRKGADAIVVNDVANEGVGIDADTNAATFLTLSTSIELPEMPKRRLADRILDEIIALRRPRSMVLELDEHVDHKSRQDQVLKETVLKETALNETVLDQTVLTQTASPFATRRQLIVE